MVDCNTCTYRQKTLDPEGCFKEMASTGIIGRFLTRLLGCDKYNEKHHV
jgi:hypothetical protein